MPADPLASRRFPASPQLCSALSQWPLLKGQLSTQRCNTGLLDPRTLTTSTSRCHTWTIATSPKNLSVTVFPVVVGLSLKDTIPRAGGSCLTICSEWYKYIKSSKVASVETLGAHWLMVTNMWCPWTKTPPSSCMLSFSDHLHATCLPFEPRHSAILTLFLFPRVLLWSGTKQLQ